MHYALDDTIAAIASAPGGALRGIIRLSGPDVSACLAQCFQPDAEVDVSLVRRAHVVDGRLSVTGAQLPCRRYLWPNRRSYTRQPAAELHTIGSPPLLHAALEAVCVAGARLAEPGEFTLRAFLTGRIDLPQAEAVLGVIDADGERQLQTALTQLAGGLSGPLNELRDQLVDLSADIEAGLDFVDEDIEFVKSTDVARRLCDTAAAIEAIQQKMASRMRDRHVYRAVLTGAPNVGKSSLLNALTRRSAAIVSPGEGTTLDYVTAMLDCEGVDCELVDTAGLTPSYQEPGPSICARRKTDEQVSSADLRLICVDSSRPLTDMDREVLSNATTAPFVIVLTKVDLPPRTNWSRGAVGTSSVTDVGLDELRRIIRERLTTDRDAGSIVASTATRCRDSLRLSTESIARASQLAGDAAGDELVAAEIRVALDELGKVVGTVYTEDVLDRIFSRFCIGK